MQKCNFVCVRQENELTQLMSVTLVLSFYLKYIVNDISNKYQMAE